MKQAQFNQLAKTTFGDKVSIHGLTTTNENLAELNKRARAYCIEHNRPFVPYTKEAFENYPQYTWAVDDKCPVCGNSLGDFLFGTFKWGLVNGEGYCTECGADFRYYHYIAPGTLPLMGFALIGFPDPDATEPEEEEEDDWLNDGLDDAIIGDH